VTAEFHLAIERKDVSRRSLRNPIKFSVKAVSSAHGSTVAIPGVMLLSPSGADVDGRIGKPAKCQ